MAEMVNSETTVEIELWIPKRSDSRITDLCEEIANITDSEVEIGEVTESLIQILTSADSFDECSALEAWLPGEFPDHEKWMDSSGTRFILRISPSPPGTVRVLSQDEIDRFSH